MISRIRAACPAQARALSLAPVALCILLSTAFAQEGAAESAPAADAQDPIVLLKSMMTEVDGIKAKFEGFRQEFAAANPERQEEIRTEAATMRERGQVLLAKMADVFPQAHAKQADHADVKEALPHMVFIYFGENRYADVLKYGALALASENPPPGIGQMIGISHFANHDFEKALEVLTEAQGKGDMDRVGQSMLAASKGYGELWKKEQAIREKEKTADDLPRVVFKTNRGEIQLELFENEAPGAVGNFVNLVEKGFYNKIKFHRVIPSFMAQGGDPNTLDEDPNNDGRGGPGYTIPCECGREDARMHFSGSLSMAHAGKDTGGSQFFLTHLPTEHLNGKHTVFGRVADGLEIARALKVGDVITEAKVVRKRDHVYGPPAEAKAKSGD